MNKKTSLIFLSILILFNFYVYFLGKEPYLINSINIFFHEAGHWIYGIFGRMIGALGGFLGEATMPLLFLFYFYREQNIPGRVFSLWWLSTAFYGTSIYVRDASTRNLALIGNGEHDWAYILGRLRLLEHDQFIANIFVFCALLITLYMCFLVYRFSSIIHVENELL